MSSNVLPRLGIAVTYLADYKLQKQAFCQGSTRARADLPLKERGVCVTKFHKETLPSIYYNALPYRPLGPDSVT